MGKYLQPSHGNEIAPCQVCDLGVADMDLTRTRSLLGPKGTSLFLFLSLQNHTNTLAVFPSLLFPLYVFARKMFAGKLLFTRTFDVSGLLL